MSIFQPIEAAPNPVAFIIGGEDTRKTTLAMSAPGPIYVIGTEEGHEKDTVFRQKGDKEVFVTNFVRTRPDAYPNIWFGGYKGMWDQIKAAAAALQALPSGTVVIDSASDLFPMAAAQLNKTMDRGDRPIAPLMYQMVYPLLRDLVNDLRPFHRIVMTARLKEEYQDDSPTGRKVMNLWRDAEHLSEHIWWMEVDQTTRIGFAHVSKGVGAGGTIANPTWEKLVEGGVLFGNDDREFYNLIKKLPEAYAYLDSKGIAYDRAACTTVEEVKAHIAQLTELATGPAIASTNGVATTA